MNDPALVGAYFTGFIGIIVAIGSIIGGIFNSRDLKRQLRDETEKREELEEKLAAERKSRFDCLNKVARLEGSIAALQMALKSKGVL